MEVPGDKWIDTNTKERKNDIWKILGMDILAYAQQTINWEQKILGMDICDICKEEGMNRLNTCSILESDWP